MNQELKKEISIRNRQQSFQQVKKDFPPGTTFRIKMRRADSLDIHGKKYRSFRVIRVVDNLFICEDIDGRFKETFTVWDIFQKAELIRGR